MKLRIPMIRRILSSQSTLLRCKTMFTIAGRSLPTRDGSSQNKTRRSIFGDFDIYDSLSTPTASPKMPNLVVSSVKALRGPDFDPATQSNAPAGSILDSKHIGCSLLKIADLDAIVKTLHIVACKNEFNEPEQGGEIGNHWFSLLELEDGRSVSVDMMGGDGGGRMGLVLLESHAGRLTTYEDVHRISIGVAGERTVKDFLECLFEKGRERYGFTVEITGCRWWNLIAVGDWEEAEMIEGGNLERVKEEISRYWDPEGREDGILEMTRGDFY